jgi:S-methylmethionine-dependent homocysteine/selenocysteine methylase
VERYAAIRARLERNEVVVLDGAMGAELVRRGVRWRGHGMRSDAAAVRSLHEEYLGAGADVIRTNTFQLNRRTYLNVFRSPEHMRHIGAPGLETRAAELTRMAAVLAREARERSRREEAVIAGVMSPLEHCFRPDLSSGDERARGEHAEVAGLLADGGVDLLLVESMNTVGEARAAAEAARATGLPVWVGFVVGADGELLGGEPLAEGLAAAQAAGAEAVLVSHAPPDDVARALEALATRSTLPFGAYAMAGAFDPPSWKFDYFPQFSGTEAWSPERYAAAARGWRAAGARIVGGCGGTGPEHVRALKAELAA